MKKIQKIISIILINVFLLLLLDILFFSYICKEEIAALLQRGDKGIPSYKYSLKLFPFEEEYKSVEFRPIMNYKSKKRPIIIFGCSYAYGYIFDNSETISYIMSKYSDRPIFNRAINGWGIQHAIYQLNDSNFLNLFSDISSSPPPKLFKKPKYVFYILMEPIGHFHRLYCTNFPNITKDIYYLTYKKMNNNLVRRNPLCWYNLNIFKYIQNKWIENKVSKEFYGLNKNKHSELLNFFILHFRTINNLIKQKWGNDVELIILTFEDTKKELWAPILEEEGIHVIDIAETIGVNDLRDLSKGYYKPEKDSHPTGKVWIELLPKIKEMYPDL